MAPSQDLANYAAMNAIYKEYFPVNPPTRYCIRADLVRPEFLVEIGSVAYLQPRRTMGFDTKVT